MTFEEQMYHSLQPSLVSAYLSAKGWQAAQDGTITRWTHADSPDPITIESDGTIGIELAEQLGRVEHRPAAGVLTELRHADADVLRVMPAGAQSATLLLDQGNRLLRGVQK